jgi:cobalt-zinc-cadmium resistance protein CzcA
MVAMAVTAPVRERENGLLRAMTRLYRPALAGVIRRPAPMILFAVLLFAAAVLLFLRLGQKFTPALDEKNIVMEVRRIPSIALSQSQSMQLEIEKAVARMPQVAFVYSRTGTPELAADPMPPSASDTYIILKPRQEWPDPAVAKTQLIRQIDQEVAKLPGNRIGFSQPIQMRFNELIAGVRDDLAVKVFGDEFEPMLRAANRIASILRRTDGAADVRVEDVEGLPFLEIRIDKSAIARRGLSLAAVQDVIGTAIGGREAGLVFEGDRRFQIVVRLPDRLRGDLAVLDNLPVPLPGGGERASASVPLREVASFAFVEGPNQISRENGKRRVVVTANVRGRDIGSVVADAQARIDAELALPPGYWLAWGGQLENLNAARQRLMIVVPACFLLIFLLLLGALGTVRDAVLVFSAVPLALTGGVAALWLAGLPFSVSAAVGFIALSGIAVLNGLVMLSLIKRLVTEGQAREDAIRIGALTRLRPVVITALVAALGFVPMAVATGTGAEVQKPIATVVIGGLISATLLTLLVLPALYARFGRAAASQRTEAMHEGPLGSTRP